MWSWLTLLLMSPSDRSICSSAMVWSLRTQTGQTHHTYTNETRDISGLCLGIECIESQCSVEGRVYLRLRDTLEVRLWFSSWISSRASSRLWLCLDFLLLNLLLPLLPPRSPTPSRQLAPREREINVRLMIQLLYDTHRWDRYRNIKWRKKKQKEEWISPRWEHQ